MLCQSHLLVTQQKDAVYVGPTQTSLGLGTSAGCRCGAPRSLDPSPVPGLKHPFGAGIQLGDPLEPFSLLTLYNFTDSNLADLRLNLQRKQVIREEKPFLCGAEFQRVPWDLSSLLSFSHVALGINGLAGLGM